MHINPDHYLETEHGRVFTDEGNQLAWERCFADLEEELDGNANIQRVYLLIGAQASGKSTWAKEKNNSEPDNIIFDAILVKKQERKSIINLIHNKKIAIIAIVFHTSLALCLKRNETRALDTRVDESALRNVFNAIEMPSLDEGFREIIVYDAG
ncbi:AAA family ATPase [Acinetobacter shaoyimingii]|uniref:ATP-binding protein n=1 Tax=Acinetobacter shaoyimingii TaxID=2715164 RepID=A0A6G8RXH2_9GAMM|nr:AAA family ATPase [Acinetobacter shaoyimingii]QIO06642.1 ATP-binding protein [Acinetobacter shaoyimingii]